MLEKQFVKVVTSTMLLSALLGGCASTDEDSDGGMLDDLSNMMSSSDAGEEQPLWANEPLVTVDECNSFTMENIESFMTTYSANSQEIETDSAKLAGKKAMERYTLAAVLVNRAQLCMAEALNMKETIDTLRKEREILLSGTSMSKGEIEKHRQYSAQASEEVRAYSAKIDTIEPEKRETLILGISTYLTGTYTTVRVQDAVERFIKKSSDAISNNTAKAKSSENKAMGWINAGLAVFDTTAGGSATLYNIGSGMTDHLLNLYDTGTYLMSFAQSENLELPSDATSEFLSVSDWGEEQTM